MKLDAMPKKTGLCRVCGKPTKLLIHSECSKKAMEGRKDMTEKYNATKLRYKSGWVPKFAKD